MKKLFLFYILIAAPCELFAMADYDTPVYGRPTLYGEYEISADDVRCAGDMYGSGSSRVKPVRITAPVAKTPAAKHPIKPQGAVKKKSKSNIKKEKGGAKKSGDKKIVAPEKAAVADNAPVMVANTVPDTEIKEKTEKTQAHLPVIPDADMPAVNENAKNIADAALMRIDIDSYCTQRGSFSGGNFPAGIIVMPGRPDLMSCGDKK